MTDVVTRTRTMTLVPVATDLAVAVQRVRDLQAELAGMRTAMEHRAVIEQAKGVLIGTLGCDEDAAFDLLVRQSQHENRKVREVATDLVQGKIRPRVAPSPVGGPEDAVAEG